MGSRTLLITALCLAASLAVACGTEDDSAGGGGAGGTSGHSGAAGKAGSSGSAGKAGAGGGTPGAGSGGTGGGVGGEGGEAGTAPGCTPFAPFVHGLIKDSTTDKAVPTPVNGIVFCDDPQDPAAFSDLF